MGVIVHLPTSEGYPYPAHASPAPSSFLPSHYSGPPEPLNQDEVRAYMRTHSLKGCTSMARQRSAFIGQIESFTSPEDPEVNFGIKHVGNKEVIAYQNMSATVRYIQEDTSTATDTVTRFVTEKEYPVGSMKVDTVLLALARWNIQDASGAEVEINKDNLIAYTSPGELDSLFDEVTKINPVLTPNGKQTEKND